MTTDYLPSQPISAADLWSLRS